MSTPYEIAIVGGGLTGLAAAITAARAGFSVLHFAPEAPPDNRTSALMNPSVAILMEHGLIDTPANYAVPLQKIRIIDATERLIRAPETLFNSAETGLDQFGWNFANAKLLAHFAELARKADTLTTITQPLADFTQTADGFTLTAKNGDSWQARLLVGADGKKSMVRNTAGIPAREQLFKQSALVCDLELERPLNGTSIEFHYPDGPFTLVPAGEKRANLVWIDEAGSLKTIQEQSPDARIAAMRTKSQYLFGNLNLLGRTFVFPLSSISVSTAGTNAIALIGEAAHAFPPIGAQGLNLGLRDVADLSTALHTHNPQISDWATRVSQSYAQSRNADLQLTSKMVDGLFGSLISDFLPAQAVRASGLWALKLMPGLRHKAFAAGMGGAR